MANTDSPSSQTTDGLPHRDRSDRTNRFRSYDRLTIPRGLGDGSSSRDGRVGACDGAEERSEALGCHGAVMIRRMANKLCSVDVNKPV